MRIGQSIALLIPLLCVATGVTKASRAADGFHPTSMAYILQPEAFEKDRAKAVTRLASCGRDLVVLDTFFEAGAPWKSSELETIRSGKKGRRIVAYLSIGEAEDYRDYWHKDWATAGKVSPKAPAFLCAQDPDWKGNFKVRYWQAEWQKIILTQLDPIVAQGFDGVYLDIVDGFEYFEEQNGKYVDHRKNPETGNEYRRDMIDWVKKIAGRARQVKPDFLVIPQNGSQLAEQEDFVNVLDAIGIEDLFGNGNKRQPKSHTDGV